MNEPSIVRSGDGWPIHTRRRMDSLQPLRTRRGMATNIRSPRVRAARALAKRALRERSRQFLAEGPQAVREALRYRFEHGAGTHRGLTDCLFPGQARRGTTG